MIAKLETVTENLHSQDIRQAIKIKAATSHFPIEIIAKLERDTEQ